MSAFAIGRVLPCARSLSVPRRDGASLGGVVLVLALLGRCATIGIEHGMRRHVETLGIRKFLQLLSMKFTLCTKSVGACAATLPPACSRNVSLASRQALPPCPPPPVEAFRSSRLRPTSRKNAGCHVINSVKKFLFRLQNPESSLTEKIHHNSKTTTGKSITNSNAPLHARPRPTWH